MGSPHAAELADLLAAARRELIAACEAVPAERFAVGPGGDEWSAAQIMAHIIEGEDLNMVMIERMLRLDNPQVGRIEHYAARRLQAVADHGKDGRDVALGRFRAQTAPFDAQIRALSDADLVRTGRHLSYGDTTAEGLLKRLAGHMQEHAQQIRRLAGAGT